MSALFISVDGLSFLRKAALFLLDNLHALMEPLIVFLLHFTHFLSFLSRFVDFLQHLVFNLLQFTDSILDKFLVLV